jgi:hypothetical protein
VTPTSALIELLREAADALEATQPKKVSRAEKNKAAEARGAEMYLRKKLTGSYKHLKKSAA